MTAISTKAAHSSARSGAPTAQTLGCPQEVSRKPAFRQNCMIDEMQYTHGENLGAQSVQDDLAVLSYWEPQPVAAFFRRTPAALRVAGTTVVSSTCSYASACMCNKVRPRSLKRQTVLEIVPSMQRAVADSQQHLPSSLFAICCHQPSMLHMSSAQSRTTEQPRQGCSVAVSPCVCACAIGLIWQPAASAATWCMAAGLHSLLGSRPFCFRLQSTGK